MLGSMPFGSKNFGHALSLLPFRSYHRACLLPLFPCFSTFFDFFFTFTLRSFASITSESHLVLLFYFSFIC